MTAPSVVNAPPIDDTAPGEAAGQEVAQAEGKRGPLLDLPEEQAAKEALRLWKQHDWFHQKKAGENKQCQLWRSGQRFVKLVAQRERGVVRIVTPASLDALPPVPNKVEEQVRNVIATIMADKPRLEAEPANDSPEARDAAQFATRFLLAMSGESGLNIDGAIYTTLDLSATFSSGFTEVCVDPHRGGYVPLEIDARPSATHKETALVGEMPDGSMDMRPFVSKYVMPNGALSDTASGAQMTWQPSLVLHTLTSNQVRFLPRLCEGLSDAKGVVIGRFESFGALKDRYPRLGEMSPEEWRDIEQWTVPDYRRLLPDDYEQRGQKKKDRREDSDEAPDDDALICTLTVYYRSHPKYPKGCYAVFVGGKYRIHEDVLYFENEDGMPECMDIPLSQMRWEIDADGGDPYGTTSVRRLGPLDEMRASNFTSAQEFLYRFSRPRWAIPIGSPTMPEDLADIDKPIKFHPGTEPKHFPLPNYPQMGMEMIRLIDADMEGITGIAGPAMGQVAGSVRSADQQNTLIERATIAITAIRDNAQDYVERLGRLILQGARRWYDTPQLMSYRGEDGAYQVQAFERADFGQTRHVRVQRGSFTMLTPTAKNEVITTEMQLGGLTPQEGARLRRDNVSAIIGAEDNRHVLRVRRQLQAWRAGPPDELAGAQPQPQMGPDGQPAIDQMTGQPVMIDPLLQAGQQVFPLLPCDEEQAVAILRHDELVDAVADLEFHNFPPGWNQALVGAYLQARQAAGIQTIAEQQMAMQQQQQAQAQQEQDREGAEREERQGENERNRQFEMEREAMRQSARQQPAA